MSRGRPGADQLDLSAPMLDLLTSKVAFEGADGMDIRNYGRFGRNYGSAGTFCGNDGLFGGSYIGLRQFQPQYYVRLSFKSNDTWYFWQYTLVQTQ